MRPLAKGGTWGQVGEEVASNGNYFTLKCILTENGSYFSKMNQNYVMILEKHI